MTCRMRVVRYCPVSSSGHRTAAAVVASGRPSQQVHPALRRGRLAGESIGAPSARLFRRIGQRSAGDRGRSLGEQPSIDRQTHSGTGDATEPHVRYMPAAHVEIAAFAAALPPPRYFYGLGRVRARAPVPQRNTASPIRRSPVDPVAARVSPARPASNSFTKSGSISRFVSLRSKSVRCVSE